MFSFPAAEKTKIHRRSIGPEHRFVYPSLFSPDISSHKIGPRRRRRSENAPPLPITQAVFVQLCCIAYRVYLLREWITFISV